MTLKKRVTSIFEIKTEVQILTMATALTAPSAGSWGPVLLGIVCEEGEPWVKDDPVLHAGRVPGPTAGGRCEEEGVREEEKTLCVSSPH